MKKKKILALLIIIAMLMLSVDGVLTSINFNRERGSIKVYDSNDNLVYESVKGLEGYQTPTNIEYLSDYTTDAIISAEDTRFFKHFGIDPFSIARAIKSNFENKKIVSGGSTITQQVARQNLAHNKSLLKNKFIRKAREINSSIFLELIYSKEKILSNYTNTVYFGRKSYGIDAASNTYFNKPASQLSLAEAAMLAGIIKSPGGLDPILKTENAKARRNEVLDLMHNNGLITQDNLETNRSFPIGTNLKTRKADHLHFVEFALEESLEKLNLSSTEKLKGMHIYTTLNTEISKTAKNAAQNKIEQLSEKHKLSNAAVVVLDTQDSAILTMIGSTDYFNEEIQGSVNVATSLRQPGSALKPITYAQAFYEEVLAPDDIILDEKTTFIDNNGKSFVPYNYNGVFNGEVTARTALASSLNLPAVKVLSLVGVENMVYAAQKLGIKSLDNPKRYGLSVTLGGGEVTLLELTNAYNSFSRGGNFKNPYSVRKILDSDKKTVFQHKEVEGSKVWGKASEKISQTIFDILSDRSEKVLGFGRNNVLILPFTAASKTGTTTDWHDNWTFGYTKGNQNDFSVGVWVGNANNSPMYNIDGVTGAGPIWREVMIDTKKVLDPNLAFYSNRNSKNEINAVLGVDKDASATLEITKEVKTAKITNPAKNSEYIILPYDAKFEKIMFEVSTHENLFYVEYELNGKTLGGFYEKDKFKYLWQPKEGTQTLKAIFYDKNNNMFSKDETNFTVLKAKP